MNSTYLQSKGQFMLLFCLIGLIGDSIIHFSFWYYAEINRFVSIMTFMVLPVFIGVILLCRYQKILLTSYLCTFILIAGCSIAPFFHFSAFVVMILLFAYSVGLLSVSKRQSFFTYAFLVLIVLLRFLFEFQFMQSGLIPVNYRNSQLQIITLIFLSASIIYSMFIAAVLEKGIRSTARVAESNRVLKASRRQLREASEMKSLFMARMNHELRTPLHTALLSAELIREDPQNYPVLRASLSQAMSIIENVLDFSIISNKKEDLESNPFALLDGITEIITVYQRKAVAGVRIVCDLAADLPRHFIGDERRFYDIIRNLLSNAVKWTSKGQIVLKLNWLNKQNHTLECRISDTGPGIEPAVIDRVFEPFTQGRVRSNVEHGIGLGLYLVQQRVKALGGQITCHNRSEGGAEFHFWVPMQPCKQWLAEDPQKSTCSLCQNNSDIEEEDSLLYKLSFEQYETPILIVEDIEINALLLQRILEKAGFRNISMAADGHTSIELIKSKKPGLVLLDLHLPDMSGLDIVTAVSAEHPDCQFIAITGDAVPGIITRCRQSGINTILTKPVRSSEILGSIRQLLHQPM